MLVKSIFLIGMAPLLFGQATSNQLATHALAARQAESRNDFKTAVHEYEILAKLLPQSAEAQSNLGVALYFEDDKPDAIQTFQKAIALNPALFAPHLFSGLAWYRLSNPDAAVPELEKAVRLNGSDVIARTWLGYAYIAQFRYQKAIEELQAASQIESDNIDIWYALGQSYIEAGNEATAKLLAIAPDGGRAWQLAGEQSQLQGDHRRALELFEGAYERRPDLTQLRALIVKLGGTVPAPSGSSPVKNKDEDGFYRLAHEYEQDARAAFQRVIEIAPDSYRSHQIMAEAYRAEQHYEKSNEEYGKVLDLKPDLPGIHEAIGINLVRMGKLSEALKEFQAELQVQPYSAKAYMNTGNALLLMQHEKDAGKMLHRSLQLDRPPAETYKLLGKIDLYTENYSAAIKMLTKYIATVPGDSDAYYMLSRAYRAVGNKAEMNRMLDLFSKTSQDAKARSQAEKAIQLLQQQNQTPDHLTIAKDTVQK